MMVAVKAGLDCQRNADGLAISAVITTQTYDTPANMRFKPTKACKSARQQPE